MYLTLRNTLFFLISFVLVAFGEPTCSPLLSLIAAVIGFVPFFLTILDLPAKSRFWRGCLFFFAVQLVQLFWFASHPYAYIYAVWFLLSFLMGLQFGLLCLLVTRKRLLSWSALFCVPALWTLLEWSRLFFLTGFTFNPIGMMLTPQIEYLQLAAAGGIYSLTFFVMTLNALVTRFMILRTKSAGTLLAAFLLLPALGGALHIKWHEKEAPPFRALIVETKLLPEELGATDLVKEAFCTWSGIIEALLPYRHQSFDLIMMPEIVVPLAGEAPIFELSKVELLLAPFQHDVALQPVFFTKEDVPLVSSFVIAKALATIFNCPVLIGLEGVEFSKTLKKNRYFNSAFFVRPNSPSHERYDKQILLPMAEEIPASWLKPLAEQYGLFDSFQPGKGSQIFTSGPHSIATSICYEDTFTAVMRENAAQNASILTNLTNDGWYPNSKLGSYHFELSRLRACENGKPLLRSCNFGTSGAFDAFGRTIVARPFEEMKRPIQAFEVTLSTNQFATLYTSWGNSAVVGVSCLIMLLSRRRK